MTLSGAKEIILIDEIKKTHQKYRKVNFSHLDTMNIFVLSQDPKKAAQMQCDKHVVKMVLETAQLLCSPFEKGKAPYKRSHYNHPSSIWARTSKENYQWLIDHGLELCKEYSYRYGRIHKSEDIIRWCQKNMKYLSFPMKGRTPFVQVMNPKYKGKNAVSAYRKYYVHEKRNIAYWSKREIPKWWK